MKEHCDLCGEPMKVHHAEKKWGILDSATGYGWLIECPIQFGDDIRDGRVQRVDPTTVPELTRASE